MSKTKGMAARGCRGAAWANSQAFLQYAEKESGVIVMSFHLHTEARGIAV